MSFIDNISTLLGLDIAENRIVIMGEKGAYVEGVKALKEYTSEKIIFLTNSGVVTIKGRGLTISRYCGLDVAIRGKIIQVEK